MFAKDYTISFLIHKKSECVDIWCILWQGQLKIILGKIV